MKKIISSRELWLEIRKRMHAKIPKFVEGEFYYADSDRFIDEIDEVAETVEFRLNYHIGEEDPDAMVEVFSNLIEIWADSDDVEAVCQEVFNEIVKENRPETLTEGKKIKLRNRTTQQRAFDKWRKFLR